MDSTLSNAIARSIPAAESGMWPLFAGLVTVALIATLWFGPRSLDSYRRWKYEADPAKAERRTTRPCEEHSRTIKELQDKLALQDSRIADQEDALATFETRFVNELHALREFIDNRLQESRTEAQSDRHALETRLTTLITSFVNTAMNMRSA